MGRIPISRLHLSRLQLSFLFIRQLVVYAIDFSFFFILNPFNPIFNPPSSSIVQEPPGVMMMCWCFSLFAIGLCLRDISSSYIPLSVHSSSELFFFLFSCCAASPAKSRSLMFNIPVHMQREIYIRSSLASLTGFYRRHNGAKTTVFLYSTKSSTMIPFFYSRETIHV